MKRNKFHFHVPSIREDSRRLIGFVNGILEDGGLWVAAFLGVTGSVALILGNLRHSNE